MNNNKDSAYGVAVWPRRALRSHNKTMWSGRPARAWLDQLANSKAVLRVTLDILEFKPHAARPQHARRAGLAVIMALLWLHAGCAKSRPPSVGPAVTVGDPVVTNGLVTRAAASYSDAYADAVSIALHLQNESGRQLTIAFVPEGRPPRVPSVVLTSGQLVVDEEHYEFRAFNSDIREQNVVLAPHESFELDAFRLSGLPPGAYSANASVICMIVGDEEKGAKRRFRISFPAVQFSIRDSS